MQIFGIAEIVYVQTAGQKYQIGRKGYPRDFSNYIHQAAMVCSHHSSWLLYQNQADHQRQRYGQMMQSYKSVLNITYMLNVSSLITHYISLILINVWCISYLEFKDDPSVVLILLSDVSIMVRSRLCDLR